MSVEKANWQGLGRCNPTITPIGLIPDMFPETAEGRAIAKKFCRPCKVIDDCLEFALAQEVQVGVMGGKSQAERSRILTIRRKELKSTQPSA